MKKKSKTKNVKKKSICKNFRQNILKRKHSHNKNSKMKNV